MDEVRHLPQELGVLQADDQLHEAEAFMAEHGVKFSPLEALAVSWKDRRKEITSFNNGRQFGSFGQSAKKSFKVEIEELKKRTPCRRCGRVGHWKRDWTYPPSKGTENTGSSQASGSTAAGCGYVQSLPEDLPPAPFVGSAVVTTPTLGVWTHS